MSNLPEVTDAEFQNKVLDSDQPVLVDFWATWCNPCRQSSPIIEEIAKENSEKMTFLAMDVDKNPVTPPSQHITGIPAFNVYRGGELVKSIVGAQPKASLLSQLSEFLA